MRKKLYAVNIPSEYVITDKGKDRYGKQYSIFASRLLKLMRKSKITANELSEKIGVSRTTLWKFTEGYSLPSTGYLIEIAKCFGVTPDYLLGVSYVEDSYVGLSDKALERLEDWGHDSDLVILNKIFNSLISDDESNRLHKNLLQIFYDLEKYKMLRDDNHQGWDQISFVEVDGKMSYGIIPKEEKIKRAKDKIKMQLFMATKDFCGILEKSIAEELSEDIFST